MKTQLKEAKELVDLIRAEYKKYNLQGKVGSAYYFDLKCQADCARDTFRAMENEGEQVNLANLNLLIIDLKKTLAYCKAVIDLQTAEANLPPIIFG
jgi:hypothetical protein